MIDVTVYFSQGVALAVGAWCLGWLWRVMTFVVVGPAAAAKR
jgi:hypothetical protein